MLGKKLFFIFMLFLVTGTILAQTALFEVKDSSGNTIFSVYPDGIKVTNADGEDVFIAETDSVRVYINDGSDTRAARGGFAIGSVASRMVEDYLFVAKDSTRIFVADSTAGFAVGSIESGSVQNFLDLTTQNYFIGHESGKANTTGLYNAFLGYQSGYSNTEGENNLFLGYQSGYENTTGIYNTFVGYRSGYLNIGGINPEGSFNTFTGCKSGMSNIDGSYNCFYGNCSGVFNSSGSRNTFYGNNTGFQNQTGAYNTFLGASAGWYNMTGDNNLFVGYFSGAINRYGAENVFLGSYCGYNDYDGSGNTCVGFRSGNDNQYGDNNVFLGYKSGYYESGSNRLYIENTDADSTGALIWGDFDNDILTFNADVGIGTTSPLGKLHIPKTTSSTDLVIGDSNIGYSGVVDVAICNSIGESILYLGQSSSYKGFLIWDHNSTPSLATFKIGTYSGNNPLVLQPAGGNVGIGHPYPSYPLHMGSGAHCTTGGVWTNASSREYKENINNLTLDEAVETLKELNPVKFEYKNNLEEEHVGFIAEDVPDLVATADRKGMSSMDVVAVLTKVVQKQQEIIDSQTNENTELEERITEIESILNYLLSLKDYSQNAEIKNK